MDRLIAFLFFLSISCSSFAAEAKYEFSTDWVSRHVELWTEQLGHLRGKPDVHALEIGTYEGRSAIWFLENILTHPSSSITCVDLFEGSYQDTFDRNMQASGLAHKAKKVKGSSQKVLRELPWGSYDFVYVDGSHAAKDVLVDAVLSWHLLKDNGIIIFDDYQWQVDRYPSWQRPKIAIDAFLQVFEPYIDVLHKEYQVIVRKKDKVVLESEPGILERLREAIKEIGRRWF